MSSTASNAPDSKGKTIDVTVLLVVPGACVVLMLFLYPFLYGFVLSLSAHQGVSLGNYIKFFFDPFSESDYYDDPLDIISGYSC
jgi:ABC-type sugar transport system permease subunit